MLRAMILQQHPALATLSADDKLQLIRELYDTMFEMGELEPNPNVVAELHKRREEYIRHPDRIVSWDDVKRKIADGSWRK